MGTGPVSMTWSTVRFRCRHSHEAIDGGPTDGRRRGPGGRPDHGGSGVPFLGVLVVVHAGRQWRDPHVGHLEVPGTEGGEPAASVARSSSPTEFLVEDRELPVDPRVEFPYPGHPPALSETHVLRPESARRGAGPAPPAHTRCAAASSSFVGLVEADVDEPGGVDDEAGVDEEVADAASSSALRSVSGRRGIADVGIDHVSPLPGNAGDVTTITTTARCYWMAAMYSSIAAGLWRPRGM